MKSLIIGSGQIGQALFEIISKVYDCSIRDIEDIDIEGVKVLHIAFPWSDAFVNQVHAYKLKYKPELTVIHSTVAIGTTAKCGTGVVHAPERGRYPHLAFEMLKFTKFIAGLGAADVNSAREYFEACGWTTRVFYDPSLTELAKLLSNVHLGMEIAWRQTVERMHERLRLDSGCYEVWEESYNKGHEYLGQKQLLRPMLSPKPIGGHCVLPSVDILSRTFETNIVDFIRRSDAEANRKAAATRFTEEESKVRA